MQWADCGQQVTNCARADAPEAEPGEEVVRRFGEQHQLVEAALAGGGFDRCDEQAPETGAAAFVRDDHRAQQTGGPVDLESRGADERRALACDDEPRARALEIGCRQGAALHERADLRQVCVARFADRGGRAHAGGQQRLGPPEGITADSQQAAITGPCASPP